MKHLKASVSLLLLSSVSAFAADLPSIKSAPVAAPTPMWTGFYAGLNAGGTWANNTSINSQTTRVDWFPDQAGQSAAAALSGPRSFSNSLGFIGGGQIGYNFQMNVNGLNLVTGIEADIQGIASSSGSLSRWDINPNAGDGGPGNHVPYTQTTNVTGNSDLRWLGTVRGRIGYLVMPNLLVYGTGGLAYGQYSSSIQNTIFSKDNYNSVPNRDWIITGLNNISNTMAGWTAGGGVEWMFMPNWSLKAEYLYYNLGNTSVTPTNTAYGLGMFSGISRVLSVTNYSGNVDGNIVRAGVNYHFNFANVAPVVAKF